MTLAELYLKACEFDEEHIDYGDWLAMEQEERGYRKGLRAESERRSPLDQAVADLIRALDHGEPDYNSAWSMICLMAEGEGDDARVYQQMAKAVHSKLKPALAALAKEVKGG